MNYGRVVIPKEVRDKFNIKQRDPLEILIDRNTIILKKFNPYCIFCQKEKELIEFNDALICRECCNKIKNLI